MQNKKKLSARSGYRWLVSWLVVITGISLVSCESPPSQDTLPATIISEILANVEASITVQPLDTATPTASPTIAATETPVPDTPTPLPTETPEPDIYVVQEGDSLWLIAEEYRISMNAIQLANELIDANAIFVGQELVIPPSSDDAEAPPPPTETVEVIAETAESSATHSPSDSEPTTPPDTATPDVTDSNATLPTETPTSDDFAVTLAERAVLHNQILCPAAEDIESEGDAILGYSAVCHIPIVSYQLGTGEAPIIMVGGIHGGYEWNTILLAYNLLDYLRQNPGVIPSSLTVYLIPNANPDGLYAVTRQTGRFTAAEVDDDPVPGRFNGNNVDLNRNWDCDWTPNATWRDNPISGGSAPFSEIENQILRDYILAKSPVATVFLHSAATGVFASGCGQIDPASKALAEVYSVASGYPLYDGFHYYDVTGDAGDWLASQGFSSISIELTDHESLNWEMNRAGVEALMNYIAAGNSEDHEQTSQEPPAS